MKQRINWLNAQWDAEVICTPQGVPYCHQIYGYPVEPGSSRLNTWVPLQPDLNLSNLAIEPTKSVIDTVGTVDITVTLSPADPDSTITVSYATNDGTAAAGTHYTATSGTLTFAPTVTTQTITVPILNTGLTEAVNFTVTLTSPVNANITNAVCTVTINPDAGSE